MKMELIGRWTLSETLWRLQPAAHGLPRQAQGHHPRGQRAPSRRPLGEKLRHEQAADRWLPNPGRKDATAMVAAPRWPPAARGARRCATGGAAAAIRLLCSTSVERIRQNKMTNHREEKTKDNLCINA
ncbi:hypothetical protein GUJ93_ZPchr0011g28631 [Zizania palustris]|uniref:Uncharacterized protein n=1 Tax=Zizania palustris TaxID=103762 RepID=A0A8J6BPI4_ZIZPA|nr:hypothetical protein GUJ93_ZPchr0011g28631 [Zizania palustris]